MLGPERLNVVGPERLNVVGPERLNVVGPERLYVVGPERLSARARVQAQPKARISGAKHQARSPGSGRPPSTISAADAPGVSPRSTAHSRSCGWRSPRSIRTVSAITGPMQA